MTDSDDIAILDELDAMDDGGEGNASSEFGVRRILRLVFCTI